MCIKNTITTQQETKPVVLMAHFYVTFLDLCFHIYKRNPWRLPEQIFSSPDAFLMSNQLLA